MRKYRGKIEGIYMIDGNSLKYINTHLIPNNKQVTFKNICEDITTNTAYAIDNDMNLYQINDTVIDKTGKITDMPSNVKSMIVKDSYIYLATSFSMYKVPLKPSIFSNTLNSKKMDLFVYKADSNEKDEAIEHLYVTSDHNDIFIATKSHLWSLDITNEISVNNPVRYHIRAYVDGFNGINDLDSLYEACTVQAINEYPCTTTHDYLFGTRDFGVLSFSKTETSTLVPAGWLCLNAKNIKNIQSIDVNPSEESTGIKLLIADKDSLHFVSIHRNSMKRIMKIPYSAKKIVFMNHGKEVFAISTLGGFSFFKINGDSIIKNSDHFKDINIYPQVARMKDYLLINTVIGPFAVNKNTKDIKKLEIRPKESHLFDNLFLIAFIVVVLLLVMAFSLLFARYRKRSRQLHDWLKASHKMGDTIFDSSINKVLAEMRYLSFNDDYYYVLRNKIEKYMKVKQREECIRCEYDLLPQPIKLESQDIGSMISDIIDTLKVIYMENTWLNHACSIYKFLVENEQKIGKGNKKIWMKIVGGPSYGNVLYNETIKTEILDIVKKHPCCDYSAPLFAGLTDAPCFKRSSCFTVPEISNENSEEYLIDNKEAICKCINEYYKKGVREKILSDFIAYKHGVEEVLSETYIRISEMHHQSGNLRSMLVDYFRNILTYLYYNLFVINNHHIFGYNDKRHEYESYYDFQQEIIVLSMILGTNGKQKFDMRPMTLLDKMYLDIEGNDSTENSISKFKDKTKTLHLAFYKKTDWKEYQSFVNLLFSVFEPLCQTYGDKPKKITK